MNHFKKSEYSLFLHKVSLSWHSQRAYSHGHSACVQYMTNTAETHPDIFRGCTYMDILHVSAYDKHHLPWRTPCHIPSWDSQTWVCSCCIGHTDRTLSPEKPHTKNIIALLEMAQKQWLLTETQIKKIILYSIMLKDGSRTRCGIGLMCDNAKWCQRILVISCLITSSCKRLAELWLMLSSEGKLNFG